jgi:hypothetical protein
MPKVIHRNVGGPAFAIGPLEIPPMLTEVDRFRFRTGSGGELWTELEGLNGTE